MIPSIDLWASVFSGLTAAATIGLFSVAWAQIVALRNQARGWQTLVACEKYESDVVLDRCLRRLRSGTDSGRLADDPTSYRLDVTTVLNYLEGIAIGVEQELYNESIVRDHLEPIVKWYVDNYLEREFASKMDINPAVDYRKIKDLCDKWCAEPTRFRAGWRPRKK